MPSGLTLPSVLLSNSGQPAGVGPAPRADYVSARSDSSFSEVYSQQQRQRADDRAPRADASRDNETSRARPRDRSAERSDDKRAERDDDNVTQKSAKDDTAPGKAEEGKPSSDDKDIAARGKTLPADDTLQDEPPEEDGALDPLLLLGLEEASSTTESVSSKDEDLASEENDASESAPVLTMPWLPALPATAVNEATGGEDASTDGTLGAPLTGFKEAAVAQGSASGKTTAVLDADNPSAQTLPDAPAEVDASSTDAQAEVAAFARLLDGKGGAAENGARSETARSDAQVAALSGTSATAQARTAGAQATQVPGGALNMQQGEVSEALADRVMWMSSRNLKSAEIQLHPQELGRLEVRIDMQQDQTQVTFVSQHAGVRDALESQMNRLREMFQQQGMNLVDVNVSDQSRNWQGQSSNDGRQGGGSGSGSAMGVAGNDDGGSAQVMELNGLSGAVARGLVDFYA